MRYTVAVLSWPEKEMVRPRDATGIYWRARNEAFVGTVSYVSKASLHRLRHPHVFAKKKKKGGCAKHC